MRKCHIDIYVVEKSLLVPAVENPTLKQQSENIHVGIWCQMTSYRHCYDVIFTSVGITNT